MDNRIMVQTFSSPGESSQDRRLLHHHVDTLSKFLSYNNSISTEFNCEDIYPVRVSLEVLLQLLADIHEEVCYMASDLEKKQHEQLMQQEIAFFEKREAQD